MKALNNFITGKVKYFNKKDVPNMFSQFLNVRIIIYYINNMYFFNWQIKKKIPRKGLYWSLKRVFLPINEKSIL